MLTLVSKNVGFAYSDGTCLWYIILPSTITKIDGNGRLVHPRNISIQSKFYKKPIGVTGSRIDPDLNVTGPNVRCLHRLWTQPAQCQQQYGQQPSTPPPFLSKR